MHFHPDVIATIGNTLLFRLRRATQTRWLPSARELPRLVGLALFTLFAGLASADLSPPSPPGNTASGSRPSVCENLSAQALQGYKVPGRKPDSQVPWELFLSKERFDSNAAAYQAGQWVEISEQELKQYGGWVAQAAEGMIDRRERVATISGAVGVAIDIVGEVAMIVISTATSSDRGTAQPGGKVLPFPSKPSPTALPARRPKASGM
ncbi:hypothetical protein ACN28E_03600 [Archangium lansingense]|uniref:hypothetical protein n=1 Tax=Archangium lansingense TaxID=2995310 RepID=UPI003B7ACD55